MIWLENLPKIQAFHASMGKNFKWDSLYAIAVIEKMG
jgi:hypothetical protein